MLGAFVYDPFLHFHLNFVYPLLSTGLYTGMTEIVFETLRIKTNKTVSILGSKWSKLVVKKFFDFLKSCFSTHYQLDAV